MRRNHCKRILAITLVAASISFMFCETGAVYAYAGETSYVEEESVILIDSEDEYEEDYIENDMTAGDFASEETPGEALDEPGELPDGVISDDGSGEAVSEESTEPVSEEVITEPIDRNGGYNLIIYGTTLYQKQKFDLAAAIKARYTGTSKIKKYRVTKQDGVTKLDKAIIKINSKGMVTAQQNGVCLVTALDKDGGIIADCEITVVDKPYFSDLPVMTVKDSTLSLTSYLNNTVGDISYSFKSSSPKVASVDQDGTVTALKSGKTKLTVTITNSDPAYKSIKVISTLKVMIPSISAKTVSIAPGKSKTISIKKATGQVTWSQDAHTEVATITPSGATSSKCVIKAGLYGGITTINATLEDGNSFQCLVIVKQLGSRYYDDVGLNCKYDTGHAKTMISGLNAYRKKNGCKTLKTDAALTSIAAVDCRCSEMKTGYIFAPADYNVDTLYCGKLKKKSKTFTAFLDEFKGDPNEETAMEEVLGDCSKVGCVTLYNKDTGMYRTYFVFGD